jgi:hypothetical protein
MRFPLQVAVLTAVLPAPCSLLSQSNGNQAGAERITLIASRLQAGEFDKAIELLQPELVQECQALDLGKNSSVGQR